MQYIEYDRGYTFKSALFSDFSLLFKALSEKQYKNTSLLKPSIFKGFSPIIDIFENYGNCIYDFEYVPKNYEKVKPINNKNIIVCFSGGKDSTTTALHYRKLGYNVTLYHVRNINIGYTDEYKNATKIAEYVGLPIVIEQVHLHGHHEYVEHPLKNMIIANMALNYGISNNLTTKISFGNFRTALLSDNEFDVCGGDCRDMWDEYEKIIQNILPKFHMYIPNANYMTAYNALTKDMELFELCSSCMTPYRFKNQFRNRTIKNYDVELLNNRCGCCWKCCAEYIYLADHNKVKYNQNYYIHCLEILLNSESWYYYDIVDLWNNFLFYQIDKSKAKGVLKNAVIRNKKIIIT